MTASVHHLSNFKTPDGETIHVFTALVNLGAGVEPLRTIEYSRKAVRQWLVAQFRIPLAWHLLMQTKK